MKPTDGIRNDQLRMRPVKRPPTLARRESVPQIVILGSWVAKLIPGLI